MRTRFLAVALWACCLNAAHAGEMLYNGIVLPAEWPPRLAEFPTSVEKDPVVPPYLVSPPPVIPIDVGRQLFVDDFLIAETTLTRTFHLPKYHSASPVLKPDQPWEMKNPDHAAAMVFSDGVWYDPKDKLFKMWYLGGESASTGYATSTDGIRWEKPSLDVRPPSNIVQPGGRDSSTVWLDLEEKNPARHFKMFRVIGAGGEDPVTGWNNWVMAIHFSADGIHWGEPVAKTGRVVDRSTVFWNPFRKVWVYSIRHVYKVGDAVDKSYGFARRRSYVEGPDVLAAAKWDVNDPLRWMDVDRLDPQRDDLKVKPQLYNLDAIAYESLMVGFFTVWRGQPTDRHKPNNIVVGYSRDGWHWSRPDRRAFCPVSDKQGDWNANNVQSAGGGFLIVGDELYFYVSGRSGRPGNNKAGTCTTGLATLRRDGFASMDAGEMEGALTTRPVRFNGRHLFVNVDDPKGELRVEVLNQAGEVMPRFTSIPITADKTLQAVRWTSIDDLSSLANEPVRFRFHLKNGKLYAFWVSPESSGASHGYVAAGGPGFSSNRDTDNSAEWKDKSPHKSAFIRVNGVRLHYLDWGGQGDTLLFLHGVGDTAHVYDDLAPKFTNHFRTIALTRRGHGESEIPESGYDTATRVEDIRQFLDALNIRRVILVGHSAAGNELSLFAITHPDRVTKLVYLDAAIYIDRQLELFQRVPPELWPSKADMESLDSIRRYYKRINNGWSDAWEATLRANSTVPDPEKRNRALSLMVQTEARPDHTKIKAPALMITVVNPGAKVLKQLTGIPEERRKAVDGFLTEAREMKQKEIELFRKTIPNGRVVMLTNADHHCFIDREADVLREMREFLSAPQ